MTHNRAWLKRTVSIAVLGLGLCLGAPSASAWKVVYDPWNYQQNVLTAARSLKEITQQIDQLRNEAQMLMRMDLDLQKITGTISPDLARSLDDMRRLMSEADAIVMKVRETDQAMERLFPNSFDGSRSNDDIIRDAKSRWDETLAAYKRSANLQAQAVENAETDAGLLATLLDRSRSAAGNLQVTQTGNELTGLAVKQSLQLQQLLAAQHRAETMERARRLASEEEARMRFKSFLGVSSGAYATGGG